jgi:hypothetical protein
MLSENWTFQTRSASVWVCSCTDGKPHCKQLHMHKTESLAVRVCTCTRWKTLLHESAPVQDGNFAVRVCTCTRRKTSLYGCAHVQDGKPHCTGLQLYKTENLEYCVNNCKANCSYLRTQKRLFNEDISSGPLCYGTT